MNAIKFLIEEHNNVRQTFAEIANPAHREETKTKIFKTLCLELLRHETMEQNFWYPNFKSNPKISQEVLNLITEEKNTEQTIKDFRKIKTFEEWEYKFNVFRIDVENHANEEETKLFPYIESLLSEEELDKIGEQMAAFKTEANKLSI